MIFFCCLWNVCSSMLCLFDTYIAFTPTILEKTSPTIKIREQGVTLNESLLALNIVERSRPALCDHAHLFYLDFNVYRSFVISWGPIMDPSKDAYRQSVRFNCIPQFYSVNRYNFVKKNNWKNVRLYIYLGCPVRAIYSTLLFIYSMWYSPPPRAPADTITRTLKLPDRGLCKHLWYCWFLGDINYFV